METRASLIICLALSAVAALISLYAWPLIPETARIAVHWNGHGQVNGWWNKTHALAFGPLFALGLTAVLFTLLAILRLIPDGETKPIAPIFVFPVLIIVISHAHIVLRAIGYRFEGMRSCFLVLGVMLMAAGNLLGKTRRNPVFGARTPWSLKSAHTWQKTNRLAGFLLVAIGLGTVLTDGFAGAPLALHIVKWGMLSIAVIIFAASYFYWRADPEREN